MNKVYIGLLFLAAIVIDVILLANFEIWDSAGRYVITIPIYAMILNWFINSIRNKKESESRRISETAKEIPKKDLGYIPVTYNEIRELTASKDLKSGKYYYITDRRIFIRAVASFLLAFKGVHWKGGRNFQRAKIWDLDTEEISYDTDLDMESIPPALMEIAEESERKVTQQPTYGFSEALVSKSMYSFSEALIERTRREQQQRSKEGSQIIEETQIDLQPDECRCPNCEAINYRNVQSCTVCGETQIVQ